MGDRLKLEGKLRDPLISRVYERSLTLPCALATGLGEEQAIGRRTAWSDLRVRLPSMFYIAGIRLARQRSMRI